MNVFYLHESPITAAQLQCDTHVCKMPTESAQMLSTVHRMVDGEMYRAFYQTKQHRFKMAWTKRDIPEWFEIRTG